MPRKQYYDHERERTDRVVRRRERQARARGNPDALVCSNGRINFRTVQTGRCQGCNNEFSLVMTTRPHRFCEGCKAAREKEREKARPFRNRKKRTEQPRQIRYAGHDQTERPLK